VETRSERGFCDHSVTKQKNQSQGRSGERSPQTSVRRVASHISGCIPPDTANRNFPPFQGIPGATSGGLVQKHAAAASIPAHNRHPHVLRHSIAMQTIQSAGIENVRAYLGHESISSTGAYLKVDDDAASKAIAAAAGT